MYVIVRLRTVLSVGKMRKYDRPFFGGQSFSPSYLLHNEPTSKEQTRDLQCGVAFGRILTIKIISIA